MTTTNAALPGLDCGLCGFRHCNDLAAELAKKPELLARCVHLQGATVAPPGEMRTAARESGVRPAEPLCLCDTPTCACAAPPREGRPLALPIGQEVRWQDSLGRDFDFYLEHFPEEPGPREAMLPHNPMLTREMNIQPGDILMGRPLGMSCGCPITHCGVAMDVDHRTGLINWCITGPLAARQQAAKDVGYYSAEAYEGLVRLHRAELKIGLRYYFQPRMCMLQWRHSGLLNFLNRTTDGWQVRLEGLWIG